jgi:polysaccharide export outer membrane protein
MPSSTGPKTATARLGALLLLCTLPSCIGSRLVMPVEPTDAELVEFEQAGPIFPTVDQERLHSLAIGNDAYVVVANDVLEVQLPGTVSGRDVASAADVDKYLSRVRGDGTIQLPVLGTVEVAGRTLIEVEEQLKDAYYPAYVRERPNVTVSVTTFTTSKVAVMGAVKNPGFVDLRSDQLSLLGALMAAGGILSDGASEIRIHREGAEPEPLHLPVVGLNVPFEDVVLKGGETVVVANYEAKEFTVFGLVNKSGAYPYPEDRRYTLMQALAVAGGVDEFAAPRYATVYRSKPSGEVIGCTFRIDGTELLHASNVMIKPGDVVAVDHTPGSWTRSLLSRILGFSISFSAASTVRN